LAAQAAGVRDRAASTAEHALHEASDAGIKNKHWWEKAVDFVADHWDDIVAVCKVIVAVLGIVVLIIGGPLAWIVLAAALVVLADTLIKYAQGKASLWDIAFAALDCSPCSKASPPPAASSKWPANSPPSSNPAKPSRTRQQHPQRQHRGTPDRRDIKKLVTCGDPVDVAQAT